MNLNHPSIAMIETVANALGELKDKVVFVGGSTVAFYLEDEGLKNQGQMKMWIASLT